MTKFGKLLKEHRSKCQYPKTGKPLTQADLSELLSTTPASIGHWETGRNQIHIKERTLLVNLLQVLYKYGGLKTLAEANTLLTAGGYSNLTVDEAEKVNSQWLTPPSTDQELINECQGPIDEVSADTTINMLSPKEHILIGRDALVKSIVSSLSDKSSNWIISIDGLGGIGKTALAREASDHCFRDQVFQSVIWIKSATHPSRFQSPSNDYLNLTFASILDVLGNKLGIPKIGDLAEKEKIAHIRTVLRNRKTLIVLDNLETAAEPQHQIAEKLLEFLNPSKALLTSRYRFFAEFLPIHLTGLTDADSYKLINYVGKIKNVKQLKTAKQGQLEQIVKSAGGSPLAIQLIIGLLHSLPIEMVLTYLQKAESLDVNPQEDNYVAFYKHIYQLAWRQLSEPGKQLLLSMGFFEPSIGADIDTIKYVSQVGDKFMQCINELWRLSFLEIGDTEAEKGLVYYLHPLTHNFVQSEFMPHELLIN